MKIPLVGLTWAETKTSLRLWIERQKRDPNASGISKALASSIWFLHFAKAYLRNFPRTVRIYIRMSSRQNAFVKVTLFLPLSLMNLLSSRSHKENETDWEAVSIEEFVSPAEREAIADKICSANNSVIGRRYMPDLGSPTLASLKADGIVRLSDLSLTPEKVRETVEYLERKPVYAAHVPVYSDGVGRDLKNPEARQSPFGSYQMEDTIGAPNLMELAFNPKVLALVEGYLGCAPTLFSAHSWWSFPKHAVAGPQTFHRDMDDYRFLALFIFLTDVHGGRLGGEHDFIFKTHRHDTLSRVVGGDDRLASEFFPPHALGTVHDEEPLYRRVFTENVQSITGPAGSVFLADTYGLHRGVRPTESGRLVCWLRFGLRKNHAYVHMKSKAESFDWSSGRIEDNPYNRFVSRLILKPAADKSRTAVA